MLDLEGEWVECGPCFKLLSLDKMGLVRESNPGPLAPEARIIPLDQQASIIAARIKLHRSGKCCRLFLATRSGVIVFRRAQRELH